MGFQRVATAFILPFPYGDAIGEKGKINLGNVLVFASAICLV